MKSLLAYLLTAAAAIGSVPTALSAPVERPALVIVISADMIRGDFLSRFEDLFRPPREGDRVGGFRYLMEEGAHHLDAHHDHFPLYTGPGHAVLLTGALPYKHGVVGNGWFDRAWGKDRNCVEDPAHPQLGGAETGRPVSAATLLTTTVGDELKMATGGRSKVWGLAFKDRAAVLMAGHLADGAIWTEWSTGRWVTSSYFAKEGKLPGWIEQWNKEKRADAWFGRTWDLSVPRQALERVWTRDEKYAEDSDHTGLSFPHRIDGGEESPGEKYYSALSASPFGTEHLLDLARELIRRESLGADAVPDLLALGLSSSDLVGHAFGPDSAQVLDMTVRTDALLAEFFNWLRKEIPGGLDRVTLVISSDHGVAPVALAAMDAGLPAGYFDRGAAEKAVEKALDEAFGEETWVSEMYGANLYLNREAISRRRIPPAGVERIAAEAARRQEGYYAVYTREQILEGRLPDTDIGRRVARSYHPDRSGDLVLIAAISWLPGRPGGGSTHGRPYTYDTFVPLLMGGAGIRPGVFAERVSTLDLAPTLSALLGILPPSGSEGRILGHALRSVGAD